MQSYLIVLFSSANISSLRCNCYQAVGVESLMTCLMLLFSIFVELYILLHTTVQIKDDERPNAWNTFASHMSYLVRRRIFIWKLNSLQVKGKKENPSVRYSVDFITAFRKLYVLWSNSSWPNTAISIALSATFTAFWWCGHQITSPGWDFLVSLHWQSLFALGDQHD